jgi:glycosyltransferase involved in cell wall biosynthesis
VLGEIDTIVFSKRGFTEKELAPNVVVLPTNSRSRFLYVRDAVRIGKKLNRPDWVTVQDPFESGIAGMRLATYFNSPLLVQIHTDIFSPYFTRGSVLNKIRTRMAPRVLARAARIRVVSNRIKEGLIKNYGIPAEKIIVLPIFTSQEEIQASPKTGERFLVVSRLTKEKNIPLALTAFAFCVKKHPNATLTILGDGPEKDDLVWLSKTLDIEKKVTFTGWVNNSASYFKNADIFLQSSWYEGYGLTFIEAAAHHLPIVSTGVGITKEVGAYIAKHNSIDFSQKIEEALRERRPATLNNLNLFKNFDEYLLAYKESFSK